MIIRPLPVGTKVKVLKDASEIVRVGAIGTLAEEITDIRTNIPVYVRINYCDIIDEDAISSMQLFTLDELDEVM